MKIFVKAKTRAKEERIILQTNETHFVVFVKELPIKGKANEAIIKVLAEYFKVSKSAIKLVSGFSSKNKIFEVIKEVK